MITDYENIFSPYQANVRAVGAFLSTHAVDLGSPGTPVGAPAALVRDFAAGKDVPVEFAVTTAFASGGSATLLIELITSAAAALSSPTVMWSSGAIAVASLTLGLKLSIRNLPRGILQRYLGARYTVATADMTAGTIWGGIGSPDQSNA